MAQPGYTAHRLLSELTQETTQLLSPEDPRGSLGGFLDGESRQIAPLVIICHVCQAIVKRGNTAAHPLPM